MAGKTEHCLRQDFEEKRNWPGKLSAETVKLKDLETSPLLGPNEVVPSKTLSVDFNLGSHTKTTTKKIGEIKSDW